MCVQHNFARYFKVFVSLFFCKVIRKLIIQWTNKNSVEVGSVAQWYNVCLNTHKTLGLIHSSTAQQNKNTKQNYKTKINKKKPSPKLFQFQAQKYTIDFYKFCSLKLKNYFLREATPLAPAFTHISAPIVTLIIYIISLCCAQHRVWL